MPRLLIPSLSLPPFVLCCPPPGSPVLAPKDPAPAPCYAPWVPGQTLGLCPGWLLSCCILWLFPSALSRHFLQMCLLHVSTFMSPALLCPLPDSRPPPTLPEFPPTGCTGSVLSTTRELELLFFFCLAALKRVLCKKGWNESLYFLGYLPGHAFPCLGHSLSQWQPFPPLSVWATLLHYSQMASEATSSAF